MHRTTDKPTAAAEPAAAKKEAVQTAAPESRVGKLIRGVTRHLAVPRPPSLAEARLRMRAGRAFADDLTSEQHAAGLDGLVSHRRAPTLARSVEQ